MKVAVITISLLFILLNCTAQWYVSDSTSVDAKCNHILKLFKGDSILELSDLVDYPLIRPYPIPDITTPQEFILYYPVLFDSRFKQSLRPFHLDWQNNYFQGNYYIDSGLVIDEYYFKIKQIQYSSAAETKLQQKLEKEIRKTIYPPLKNFKSNWIVGESGDYVFRVDCLEDNSKRFACWHKGQTIAEKPYIIIDKGEWEGGGGSGPWWGIDFKKGDWTYRVDYGGHDGYMLSIFFKGEKQFDNSFKVIK